MVTLKQIVAGAGIVVLAGGAYLNGSGILTEKKDLIYQGYHANKTEGVNSLVFDGKSFAERIGNPDLRINGNPYGLKIGEKYDVEVKSPRWFGEDVAVSVERSD
ncbi:hypothetical protein KAJ38_01925 [Candidatus Pacearchaeota archaeon]|nr:hypothetical protein [Candidatus Pacearchaeota archaeon]